MTIASASRLSSPFVGTGAAATLPFTFAVATAADVEVFRVVDGVETILTPTTDYTVTINEDQSATPGGSVAILAAAYTLGENHFVTSATAATQDRPFATQSGLNLASVERALDRLTIIAQEHDTRLDASLRVARGESVPPIALGAGANDGMVLGFVDGEIVPVANSAAEAAQYASDALTQAGIATTQAGLAAASAAAAGAAQTGAETALAGAQAAALTSADYYPGARSYVPRGLTAVAITAAGSGGTNGSYTCPLTGDNLTVDAYATVTVSGGAVTAVSVAAPGLYIGASPTAGTVDTSSITGLAGATLTPTIGYLKTSGEYYLTNHASDGGQVALFQNQANVAVEVDASVDWLSISAATASSAFIADMIEFLPTDADFVLRDPEGNVAFKVTGAGMIENDHFQSVEADAAAGAAVADVVASPVTDNSFTLADAAGNVVFRVNSDGSIDNADYDAVRTAALGGGDAAGAVDTLARVLLPSLAARTGANVLAPHYALLAQMAHVLIYGQSLSLGTDSLPVLSSTPSTWAKMFGAVRTIDAAGYGALNALVETANGVTYGETPASGAAQMFAQLMLAENGVDLSAAAQHLLFSAPGEGGLEIAQLMSGTTPYTRLAADIAAGQSLSGAAGKTYLPQAVLWMQGERDTQNATAPALYKQRFRALMDQVNATALAATGMDWPVPWITYQMASHRYVGYNQPPEIAVALWELARDNADIALACPLYFLEHVSDDRHLTNASSRRVGAYFGLALKRWLVDGVKPPFLNPLEPVWFPDAVVIPFDAPSGKIVPDTTTVTDPGSYGFTLADAGGTAITISSVTPLPGNRVAIKAAASLPTGSQVRYGWGFSGQNDTGPVGGARGNIRDTQGDDITFNGARMDNWCPIFRYTRT